MAKTNVIGGGTGNEAAVLVATAVETCGGSLHEAAVKEAVATVKELWLGVVECRKRIGCVCWAAVETAAVETKLRLQKRRSCGGGGNDRRWKNANAERQQQEEEG